MNVTRNATEAMIKQNTTMISQQVHASYASSTAEVGMQVFRATIGLFGQILAKSVAR